jgi:hypothetical protein
MSAWGPVGGVGEESKIFPSWISGNIFDFENENYMLNINIKN